MPEILVITGACGVGKSTVAKAWATSRGGASIRADEIRHWICDTHLRIARDHQEGLVRETTIAAAGNLLAQGVDVALDNVWFPESMELICQTFAPTCTMQFVVLRCESDENHRRDLLRPADGVMGDRVDVLRRELDEATWPAFVRMLDTSRLTLRETLKAIESLPVVTAAAGQAP